MAPSTSPGIEPCRANPDTLPIGDAFPSPGAELRRDNGDAPSCVGVDLRAGVELLAGVELRGAREDIYGHS